MFNRLVRLFAWSFVLAALAVSGAFADSPQDVAPGQANAPQTTRRPAAGKEYRYGVRPHWIDGERFWYRRDGADGKREFFLVDPAAGTKKPACDPAALAAALSKVMGRTVRPDALPVDSIAFDGPTHALRIQVGEKTYAVSARDGSLSEAENSLGRAVALAPDNAPRRSRNGGAETTLTFVNHTGADVSLIWLDTDGGRHDYGALLSDAQRRQNTFAGHVWRIIRKDGSPLSVFVAEEVPALAVIEAEAPEAAPPAPLKPDSAVSPDGKWRGVFHDNNLFLRDAASGRETALTTNGKPEDRYDGEIYWSPDSRHLIAFQTIPAQAHPVSFIESSPSDQLQPKLHTIDYLKPGDRIAHPRPRLFDVAARKAISIAETLFPNPWDIDNLRWEPGSERFTFLYNQRGHQVMRLISVNAETGAAQAVIEETSPTFIDYSGKTFLHRTAAGNEAIWMSERDGWNHLYLIDTLTGKVKNQITKGAWIVRDVERVDEAKRQIWFRAGGLAAGQDPYYLHSCRVNFDGGGLTVLTEGNGTHTTEISPDGKFLLDTYSRIDLPPRTTLRRMDTGKLALDLDAGEPETKDASTPERFTAKGRDGKTDIYGIIVRPSNFDPSKKYPVLENIYAGPQGAFVPKGWGGAAGMQRLADLGFIVIQCDGMGTNWRSRAFHDVCWKNLSDSGFPDRIAWIKAAAQSRPFMDLTRVGIYGTSAGGQNALAGLLLHGDFYKAGVSDCGCQDNRMDKIWWNEQWMGWPVGPEYAANSNVALAPKLTGKLLLMVGEMDTNVDPASTMQVVNALIKANKDFELLVMPGAGHGVAGTPYGQRRLLDFFVRNFRE